MGSGKTSSRSTEVSIALRDDEGGGECEEEAICSSRLKRDNNSEAEGDSEIGMSNGSNGLARRSERAIDSAVDDDVAATIAES